MPDRGDSMDSNDSSVPGTPALHRRSSLYLPSSKGHPAGLFPSTKTVQREGSDDGVCPRTSAEDVRESQEVHIKHRSKSMGAIVASAAGASKKAKLRALGLVLDSSILEP